jgi:hypothetical protein
MRKLLILLVVVTLIFALAACFLGTMESDNPLFQITGEAADPSGAASNEIQSTGIMYSTASVLFDGDDEDSAWDKSESTIITLDGDSIAVDGKGTIVDGSLITITSAGTYLISGTLDNGQIEVSTGDKGAVRLVLNGVNINCADSAPVYVASAEKVIMVLADGAENRLTDGENYVFEYEDYDEPSAAVFSKSDLTINGSGSLIVDANYNNGIQSKDDLKITGGHITVNAVNDGIKGRDSIVVKNADILVNAGADGIQSNNDEDVEKGYVSIESGAIDITAVRDGIHAETDVIISGGDITITTGGGSTGNTGMDRDDFGNRAMPGNRSLENSVTATETNTESAKGIKAGVNITITGGTIAIDAADDALNTNDSLTIDGGDITLASGDDAMHADSTLEINGGDINIVKCYEGIESKVVTVNGGNIHLIASDDGFNISDGSGEFMMMGRPGQGEANADIDKFLYINGGYIVVDSGGDGLDVNGSLYMTGGTVIVHGPTNDGNGPLDYLGTCRVTGGLLIAAGSSGMAQAPDNSSTQYSLMVNFSETQAAGTLFHVESAQGVQILTFMPAKSYQSVVLCSPDIKNGSTYIIYTGGGSTGTNTDGLYSGGPYIPGTEYVSMTVSGMTTVEGRTNVLGGQGGDFRNNRGGALPENRNGEFPGGFDGDTAPPEMSR